MMRLLMSLLATVAGLYSLLIIIRMLLSWFGHTSGGGFMQFMYRVTSPYLDWWRKRFKVSANMPFDFSPIAALAALSIIQTICSQIASYGRIGLGVILSILLSALWSAISFIIGFCTVVLVLRFIGYMINCNMFSPFWSIIDAISRNLLFSITRIIFRNRIVGFMTGLLVSIAALVGIWILGGLAMNLFAHLLGKMPF